MPRRAREDFGLIGADAEQRYHRTTFCSIWVQRSAPGAKRHRRNAGGESEACLRFNRQGLQSERAAKATNERVGANPGPDGCRRVDANIVTCERLPLGSYGWGKNIPGQHTLIGRTDIQAEFTNSCRNNVLDVRERT